MSDKEQPNVIPITNERLMSLDAFRGFIMFWIVGGEALVYALSKLDGVKSEILNILIIQLQHVSWEGFRFYDLIFPSFVFIRKIANFGQSSCCGSACYFAGAFALVDRYYLLRRNFKRLI